MKTLTIVSLLLVLGGCKRDPESGTSSPDPGAVTHKAKLREVKKKAAQVAVGMKRSEVELLFPEKDSGRPELLPSFGTQTSAGIKYSGPAKLD